MTDFDEDCPIIEEYLRVLQVGAGRVLPSEAAAETGQKFGLPGEDVLALFAIHIKAYRRRE